MTGIEWTQEVWNPTTGCDRVSDGCAHCYAMTMAKRLKGMGQAKYQRDGDPKTSGPGFGLTVHPAALDSPLRWREPRRIFVNSMSDLFHADVPDDFIAQVFGVMCATPRHTYQVLTKRHARLRSLLSNPDFPITVLDAMAPLGADVATIDAFSWPLPNVHIGVSVEDQHWADIRIPALTGTPAAVRFISAEPLLGPVDLSPWLFPESAGCNCGSPLGVYPHEPLCGYGPALLDWVIAGGESGSGARRCDPGWLRSLRNKCDAADVPFFLKQVGSVLGRELGAGPKGGVAAAFPEDLRVREFPRAAEAVPS